MSFVEQYLLQLNTEKRRLRQSVMILTVLSLIVALVTVWSLRMTGVTIANGATCGCEEHLHIEECLQDNVLICGYEEHSHSLSCYSDSNADVETAEDWEATIPELIGEKGSDVLLIAKSQLGYTESDKN